MRKSQSLTQYLDWPLFVAYLLLVTMGLATVYSTAYDADHPNLFDFSQKYGKQVIWIAVSFFLGLIVFLIDSSIYRKFAIPIYLFTLSLLVLVLFMPPINGARAWLGFGSFGIQPAEFAKIATALLLSHYLSNLNMKLQNVRNVLVANLIILIPMTLIALQPDAGTLVVFTSFLFVLYREGITYDPFILPIANLIPGIRLKQTWLGTHFIPILVYIVGICVLTLLFSNNTYQPFGEKGLKLSGIFFILAVLFLGALALYWFLSRMASKRERKRALYVVLLGYGLSAGLSLSVDIVFQRLAGHQKERIELVLGLQEAPDGADYNRNRAMAAVGSGGAFGKGYQEASLASVESNHVPESETDFIFCPFAEEWGFIGSIFLFGVYIFMLLRIVHIAERQRSKYYRIYAYAVGMILFYHFAINIGMNIGLAPVIGIPLPFFSYGGSSMMSFSVLLFILLKLDSQRREVLF